MINVETAKKRTHHIRALMSRFDVASKWGSNPVPATKLLPLNLFCFSVFCAYTLPL